MALLGAIIRGRYQDSVRLMRVSEDLRLIPGVDSAAVIMATPANVGLLRAAGLAFHGIEDATPDDIVLAVSATDAQVAKAALAQGQASIDRPVVASSRVAYASTEASLADAPATAVGFVAIPGAFAAAEARRLLDAGHHVAIFSDNVPIEAELDLKRQATASGLLVMGPDAGTSAFGGVGLGFSNRVPVGRVGIVAASGTGAQVVASLVSAAGAGISAVIGLGSHDPTDAIGGITMFDALDALDADNGTDVIVLIAKTIGDRTRARLLRRLALSSKPTVTLIAGWPDAWITGVVGAIPAYTLAEAAHRAAHARSEPRPPPVERLARGAGVIRGRFAGGTIAQELAAVLRALGTEATDLDILDLGDDAYTLGRPHPMIAPSIVADAVAAAAAAAETSAVVFDVVLGDGSHPDPAGTIVASIERTKRDPGVPCIAILCGTKDDPQGLERARSALQRAGCEVVSDPASAARALWASDPEARPSSLSSLPVVDTAIVIGPAWFADAVEAQGATVLHVDWRPPAGGADDLLELLARLT